MATNKSTKKSSSSKGKSKSTRSSNSRSSSSRSSSNKSKQQEIKYRNPIVNDVIGIVVCALAIALFLASLSSSDAVVTSAVHQGLLYGLGVGAYILPIPLLIWGASFFFQRMEQVSELRLGIGLLIILIALISIIACCAIGPDAKLQVLFRDDVLITKGGYIGSGIAWGLMSLFGKTISIVILVAVMLIGFVIIGFSISGLVDEFRQRLAVKKEERAAQKLEDTAPKASIQRGEDRPSQRQQNKRLANADTRLLGGEDLPYEDEYYEEDYQDYDDYQGSDDYQNNYASPLSGDYTRFLQRDPDSVVTVLDNNQPLNEWWDREDCQEESWDPGADKEAFDAFDDFPEEFRDDFESDDSKGETQLMATDDQEAPQFNVEEDDELTPVTRKLSESKSKELRENLPSIGTPDVEDIPKSATKAKKKYVLPSPRILKTSKSKGSTKAGQSFLAGTAQHLQDTLDEFKVDGRVVGWVAGPQATLYKIELMPGVRLNRITNLQGDIALALAAQAVRIVAPIPGTSLVGVEVPNAERATVLLGDVLPRADQVEGPMLLGIGKDVEGNEITADLAAMPHLLIGGTTGSGKSVAINAFIMSILMRSTPEQVRLILIDPKRVELSLYNGIPHLFVPVVTDAEKAASALAWGVAEMERRLRVFEKVGARNIAQYNEMVRFQRENEVAAQASDEGATTKMDEEELAEEMPRVVIVIDELADLMMVCGKDVETSISRISQLARAAGIHLIVATQRPSTNVITGLIKANITNRIAFTVASGIDSQVVLDCRGAEDLIGMGDMLLAKPEFPEPLRVQCCYVSEDEINAVVAHLHKQGDPEYNDDILSARSSSSSSSDKGGGAVSGDDDPLLWEAAEIVVTSNLGSTSALQRRLKVGYARAGRIMDMLEEHGIVGPPNGSKPRDVLVDELELESIKAFEAND